MIRVGVDICEGVVTRRVWITTPSIERVLVIAGGGKPGRGVRLLFLIDAEIFFVPEDLNKRGGLRSSVWTETFVISDRAHHLPHVGVIRERIRPMVGYMNPQEQVDADFSRARRRALLRRIGARLRRDTAWDGLLCFDDLRKIPGAIGRIDRGIRTVPVSQIGGSVGRCSEFDGDFMPARASIEERWKRIDRAFHRGEVLPPVSLYKVGGFYFVLDGHHRISVAAYHGVGWIDAYVTEFGSAAGGVWSERRDRESA